VLLLRLVPFVLSVWVDLPSVRRVLLPTEGPLLLRLLLLLVEEASLRASVRLLLAGDLLPVALWLLLPVAASFVLLRFPSVRLFAGVLLRLLFVRLFDGVLLRLLSGRAFAGALLRLLFVGVLLRLLSVRVFAGELLRLLSGRAFTGELFPALLRVTLLRLLTVPLFDEEERDPWLIRPLRVFFENSRLGGRPLLPGM
jgi:hypothetical protein